MFLAAATNFLQISGNPDSPLRRLAEAGFTHILWGHQWNTDFFYNADEIAAVRKSLRRFHLVLQDVHGSRGVDKNWYSEVEYERRAGVELVRNRLRFLRECEGTGVLVMHPPRLKTGEKAAAGKSKRRQADALRRSLDELLPELDSLNARIALENLPGDNWEILRELLAAYPPERIGVCFDSGHANLMERPQWAEGEEFASRIIAVHLHDNEGNCDSHLPPGRGNIPWETVLNILKKSSCRCPLTFEVTMRCTPYYDAGRPAREQTLPKIRKFLADSFERCQKIARKYETSAETALPGQK